MTRQDAAAAPANPIDRYLILAPLALLYLDIVSVLYEKAFRFDIWAFADWETSYAGGFVRRGLSGELLRLLSGPFGSQQIAYVVVNALLYAVLLVFLAIKYLAYGRDLSRVLLFVPTSIFFLLEPNLVGRKETLLFVLAVAMASTIDGRLARDRPNLYWALFGLAGAGLLFFHEALIFFYPLMFVAAQIGRDGIGETLADQPVRRVATAFALFLVPAALVFLTISIVQAPPRLDAIFAAIPVGGEKLRASCLADVPAAMWGSRGAICYLVTPLSQALRQVWIVPDGFDLVGTAILLALQLALALGLFAHGAGQRGVAWLALGVAVTLTLPLFAVAIDWGRWTFIITVLLAIAAPRRVRIPFELSNRKLLLLILIFSCVTVSYIRSPRFTLAGPALLYKLATGRQASIEP